MTDAKDWNVQRSSENTHAELEDLHIHLQHTFLLIGRSL